MIYQVSRTVEAYKM